MRYFLLAGEKSGDLHGSNLIRALKGRDPSAVFSGYGGDGMRDAGMELMRHYSEYSVMGFLEVALKANTLRKAMRKAFDDIQAAKPDALILIDFGGFNMRIASKAKAAGIRVIYYIPPKVWAWNTKRALKLKESVDQLLCILPFEPKFFATYDVESDFVGNPVNDSVNAFETDRDFRSKNQLDASSSYTALLPGSRKQELEKISQLFIDLAKKNPQEQFLLAGVSELNADCYSLFRSTPNIQVIFDDTYNLLSSCDSAVVTSGTATLETALLGVPQVVVYKGSALSIGIARRVIKVPHISLVNLILEKELVKELIQKDASLENLSGELEKLKTTEYRTEILKGYQDIKSILGEGSASENAARLIVKEL